MQGSLSKRDGGDDVGGGLSLPDDIIFDVLARVPAKDLCRLRCVCQAWRALISDPSFVAAHKSRAGPLMVAVFGSTTEQQGVRLLDISGNVLRVFDIGEGTALLAPTRLDRIFIDRGKLGAMIIDPASGRHLSVISTNNVPSACQAPTLTSTDMISDYSFGRAAASGEYKVLRLLTSSRDVSSKWCELATIMDGGVMLTWRQRPRGPFHDATFSFEDKATVNGVLYFLPLIPYLAYDAGNCIVAFDLEERKEEGAWYISLTELKGTLCVVQNIRYFASSGGHYCTLWLLVDPNKSIWIKEYRMQMPGGFLSTKPLDVLGESTTLLLMSTKLVNFEISYFLQFYNSSTEDFTDTTGIAHGFNGNMAFYTGSLLNE